MITIQTRNALLIQVHKSQLLYPMGATCFLEFTGFNNSVATFPASIQTLTNCYLLEAFGTETLETLGLNAGLKVLDENGNLVYTSKVQLFIPEAPAPIISPPQHGGDDGNGGFIGYDPQPKPKNPSSIEL